MSEEEIEELEMLNEKYIAGSNDLQQVKIAIRIKQLMDKNENSKKL
jgi:hypothetical protein